jgi:hypothetical protein
VDAGVWTAGRSHCRSSQAHWVLATWPPGCGRVGQGQRGAAVLTAGAAERPSGRAVELELGRGIAGAGRMSGGPPGA